MMINRYNRVEWDIHKSKYKTLNYGRIDLSMIRQDFLASSNVSRLAYDTSKESLFIEFHDGSVYEYLVTPETFQNVLNGRASARTTGSNQYGSWWEGKNPSVGASVHRYLISTGSDYREVGIMP